MGRARASAPATSAGAAATKGPLPDVLVGLDALRRDNPWPELPADVAPFYLSLDGGGRTLITDLIREHGVSLMLEIGCFLCGSTRQWLEASAALVVIGVDPWDGNWSLYIRKRASEGNRMLASLEDPSAVADTVLVHGNYCLAMSNIRDLRARFIPIRQRSPEALHYLRKRKIEPQLIYIDALKSEDDVWVAHQLFPSAILCGDDWTWRDDEGRYRMREHVERFVAEKGWEVRSQDATWVVLPSSRQAATAPPSWDAAAVQQLLQEIDLDATRLLHVVAAAARRGDDVTFDEVTREMGCAPELILHAAKQVNEAPATTGRPQVLGLGGSVLGGWERMGHRPYVIAEGISALLLP